MQVSESDVSGPVNENDLTPGREWATVVYPVQGANGAGSTFMEGVCRGRLSTAPRIRMDCVPIVWSLGAWNAGLLPF